MYHGLYSQRAYRLIATTDQEMALTKFKRKERYTIARLTRQTVQYWYLLTFSGITLTLKDCVKVVCIHARQAYELTH
jgi:hypothetical protein